MCLVVTYVEGHVQPARSFILFRCSTTGTNMHNGTIDQNVNCMEVDPHPSYNIIVTDNDDDAEEVINGVNGATAPVIIIGVSVPASATLSSSNTGELIIFVMVCVDFNHQQQLVQHQMTVIQ